MTIPSWLANFFTPRTKTARRSRRRGLELEPLEDRTVPAVINVGTTSDGLGNGSLRDAIIQSNTTFAGQDNVITLGSGNFVLTRLGRGENAAALGDLDITGGGSLIIRGAGAGSTSIDGNQLDRVFHVRAGVTVTFEGVTIKGGLAQDGGADAALGGGILNEGGTVTLINVTMMGNSARGQSLQGDGNRDGADGLGGALASVGGTVNVRGSSFVNNTVVGENGENGPNGGNGADGEDAGIRGEGGDGGRGGNGQHAGPGGNAIGGGIYGSQATIVIVSSTFSGNAATGGAGGNGGSGGNGGDGGDHGIFDSSSSSGWGGEGGDGAGGSEGGLAGGSAIAALGGSLSITGTQVTSNTATGGAGGNGGNGGHGGSDGTDIISLGKAGGDGGGGGKGGVVQGAVLASGTGSVVIDTTTVTGNTGQAGAGGHGGSGQGVPFDFYGLGGNGGNGGNADGGGLTLDSAYLANVTNSSFSSNTITGGAGGSGGNSADAPHAGSAFRFSSSIAERHGYTGGAGGHGGSARGGGIFLFKSGGNRNSQSTVVLATNTVDANRIVGGGGGFGGKGGNGGDGLDTSSNLFNNTTERGGNGGAGGRGGNAGDVQGGGVYSFDSWSLIISSSTISNNTTVGVSGGFGGFGGSGGAAGEDINSTDTGGAGGAGGAGGNASSEEGAGVWISKFVGTGTVFGVPFTVGGENKIINSTIANNSTTGFAFGGTGGPGGQGGSGDPNGPRGAFGAFGAFPRVDATGLRGEGVLLLNSTVAGNVPIAGSVVTAVSGGGASITSQNSIIQGPLSGGFTSQGHNLVTQSNGNGFTNGSNGDQVGTSASPLDPKLGALAFNNSPTRIMLPQAGSPAVDKGDDAVLGSPHNLSGDQRGVPRKVGDHVDIGAVELATGVVEITGTAPATVAPNGTVTFTLTLTVGDSIRDLSVHNNLSNLNFAAQGASATVPTGWTAVPSGGNLDITAPSPGAVVKPGLYTITVTLPSNRPAGTLLKNNVSVAYNQSISGRSKSIELSTTVSYPQPLITSLSPSPTNEGSGFMLTVNGSGFGLDSKVRWNGAALVTSFVNSTQLTAAVPAALHDNGTAAITVFSPTPGGGTSNSVNLAVNSVAPTGSFPDRFIAAPRSLSLGFVGAFDPATADASSLRYSYALSQAGLATSYAAASDLPTKAFDFSATTTVHARIFDKDGFFTTYTATVRLVTDNTAPTLTGANDLPDLDEDNVGNNGVAVADLLAGKFTDTDPGAAVGIAVTGLNRGNGRWQFSVNGGANWQDFGAVSNSRATLLANATTDRVRFVPNTEGPTSASISFRAWDQTDGRLTGDSNVNVTTNGGGTAYSSATATANVRVTEVNDRPPPFQSYSASMDQNTTLTIPLADLFANISAGPAAESGQTFRVLSARAFVSGVQQNDNQFRIVVTADSLGVTPYDAFIGDFRVQVRFEDDGTTNGAPDPLFQDMQVNVFVRTVNSPPAAADDTLPLVEQGSAPIETSTFFLTLNDMPGPWYEQNQGLTVTGVGNAHGGTVTVDFDGRVVFTLDPTFSGVASFEYTIRDDGFSNNSPDFKSDTGTVRFLVRPTTPTAATGLGPAGGRTYWGDYDADGDLDVLALGLVEDDPVTSVYRNDGDGTFTDLGSLGLPALALNAAPEWVDVNRDGYLDLLFRVYQTTVPTPQLYAYDPDAGAFADFGSGLFSAGGITWTVVDSHVADVVAPLVWVTQPNPQATLALPLIQVANANFNPPHEFVWGDYNGDSFLDVVAYGPSSTRLYRNDANNALTEVTTLDGSASADWVDFDQDGDLDLLLTTGVYRNAGADTFELFHTLPNSTIVQHAMWGDVTGDGRLDVVYSYSNGTLVEQFNGSTFSTAQALAYNGFQSGGWIALGDHDGDGDLDLLLDGSLYTNWGGPRNLAPAAPGGLTVDMLNSTTGLFSWTPPSDDTTATAGLTYTLRLGTTPGGSELMTARAVPGPGLLGGTNWTFAGLTRGQTYYWSVQAVDAAFVGSAFAAEASFLAECLPTSADVFYFVDADQAESLFFPFSDLDNDQLQSVEIASLPDFGVLTLHGMPLTGVTEVSRAELFDGKLVYRGSDDGTTPDRETSFEFRVKSNNFFSAETYTATVFVLAAATAPELTVPALDVTGGINTPVSLGISATLVDTDGSETLALKIEGVPVNATLSAGTSLNGIWYLTPAQLGGLTLTGQATGAFTLTVTATASESGSPITATTVKTIDVTLNGPILNALQVPSFAQEGEAVLLGVTATSFGSGSLSYTWTVTNQADQAVTHLTGASASFTPPDDGFYTVSLKIDDSAGGSLTTPESFVVIGNAAPQLTLGVGDSMGTEGVFLNFGQLVSFSDPGFGTMETFTLFINWGDGEAPFETTLAPNQATSPTMGSIAAGHTYADEGIYLVSVVLTDDDGGVAFQAFTVTIANANPVLDVVDNQTLNEGQALNLTTLATFTDTGFANAAFNSDETFSYSINWGDNSLPTIGVALVTQAGSVGTPTAGNFGGSHTYISDGVYSVEVTIIDDNGGQDTKTFQVTVENVAPTLTAFDLPTALTDGATANLSAAAEDVADALSFTWTVTPPAGPAFTLHGPSPSFSALEVGTYTVDVAVADGDGGMDTASGTIAVSDDDVSGPSIAITDAAGADITNSSTSETYNGGTAFNWSLTDSSGFSNIQVTISRDGVPVDSVLTTPSGSFSLGALAAGTYVISIQATDGDNDRPGDQSSASASATITVTKAVLTVTANNATRTYGGDNPGFSVEYAGFVNGESLTSSGVTGVPSLTTTATMASSVGTYPIAAALGSLESAHYEFQFVAGTLDVTPTALTVRAQDAIKVYGAANPTFAVDYSGFIPGEGPTALAGTPTFATTALDDSAPGVYAVTPGGLSATNYAITYVAGALSVSGDTVRVRPDPFNPTKSHVQISGSASNDVIVVTAGSRPGTLAVTINRVTRDNVAVPAGTVLSRVHVYGGAGDDRIRVVGTLPTRASLFGGSGNDRLKCVESLPSGRTTAPALSGSKAGHILSGGAGDDYLEGGNSRDLLIGGLGADQLFGNGDADLHIAGSTRYDNNTAALDALLSEWAAVGGVALRRQHLTGPVAGRNTVNGQGIFLLAGPTLAEATVYDDGSKDVLTDSVGSDWFWANLDGAGVRDKVIDPDVGTLASDVAFG